MTTLLVLGFVALASAVIFFLTPIASYYIERLDIWYTDYLVRKGWIK